MAFIREFGDISRSDVELAGGKGANLGDLVQAGLPVPPGFVLTTAAYTEFVEANGLGEAILEAAAVDPAAGPEVFDAASAQIRALFAAGELPGVVALELRAAYQNLCDADGGGDVAVAVRSSATAEDLASASFAGQQDTYLNIAGAHALLEAVVDCWASLWTGRAMAYRSREGLDPATVRLAVVVQKMVAAEASGVMFTANPANGRRNELVVSAAWGLGESVVGGTVSTDDVVVEAESGNVLSRRTGDKTVMTVYAATGTEEVAVAGAKRWQRVLDDGAAARLAALGTQIAGHFGSPQDIEWAMAGGSFFIVQARPITALPEPTGEIPTQWPVPRPKGMYFRASIVEQLPDPLSPLFADLIDGSVTRSLNALLEQAFGTSTLHEGDLGLPTINGYAYYYYRTAGLWRLMGKSLGGLRALATGKSHMGIKGWRDYSHPRYVQLVQEWGREPVAVRSGAALLDGISALLDGGTQYYTAVQSVVPIAASSELSFQAFYDKAVRRAGDPPALDFLLGFESAPIRAEQSLYDLAAWTRERPQLSAAILSADAADVAAAVANGSPLAGADAGEWDQWRGRFQQHLDDFGHAVYNLDFLSPVPADDPMPLLGTLKYYLHGEGVDPALRQKTSSDRRAAATEAVVARLDPVRRKTFTRLLEWAQQAAPIREDALADIGLAWPLMRRMLLELGRRLATSGLLAAAEDVFWLRLSEARSAVDFGLAEPAAGAHRTAPVAITGVPHPVLAAAVEDRRMTWRGQRLATAPQLLPETGWAEKIFGAMMPAGNQRQTGGTITGIGASGGKATAPVRVLNGPEDFHLMRPGEVLVARMTTPAWTSLFVMAAAVVTDVGGPLSHSSIVAREYRIPAVLGTGVATSQLKSGQLVVVDGDAGTVTLVDADQGLRK
ncbi:PEP/pyruvate-binding domain-containing protein [Arthrobacter sp. 35W]|uniref:PEP/pyruvate-binding domain-containing protein n=1 Tax=Arthrobacter sp. 35W TaxID=1132441 RepID=UPI0004261B7C|nr:PEP/pyruvate-binding domain-containing protein [Arthrobacter sp. 35W]